MKRTRLKSKGQTEVAKLREQCDKLLTPLIKLISPNCESCGNLTQVGHHWIEKSRSNRLRYEIENIIPLCNPCHTKIHNRFGNSVIGSLDVAEKIIKKRGKAWKNRMDRVGREIVKVNKVWYEEHLERLNKLIEENEDN